jgi:hypothetical protein
MASNSAYANNRCASVSSFECIGAGKVRDLTKLSESTEDLDLSAKVAQCCKSVDVGSCKNQDGEWKKEFCYAQGKDFNAGNSISSSGNDCCSDRDDDFICRDLDWHQCWGVDEFGTPVELAKAPDPNFGYALRYENPYLIKECKGKGDECKKWNSKTYFPEDCKDDFTWDGECTQAKVCENIQVVAQGGACRAWDSSWKDQYDVLGLAYKDTGLAKCCYSFDDPDKKGGQAVSLKCTGNLYVGDIGGPQKEVILWENIKKFVGTGVDNDCGDTSFDVDDPASCLCKDCSAGSNYYKEMADPAAFRIPESDNPGCAPLGEECKQDVHCYEADGEGGIKRLNFKEGQSSSSTDASYYLVNANKPSGMQCTNTSTNCVDGEDLVEFDISTKSAADLDLGQSCIPAVCDENDQINRGCDSDSAADLDPGKATKDALDGMGFDQTCKQQASTQSASFAASTKASCPFGSVGAQVSGTAMNNQMSQSGCGVFSATVTNVQNLQQNRTCIEENITNTSNVAVSAGASVTIGNFAVTQETINSLERISERYQESLQNALSAFTNPNLTTQQVQLVQSILDSQEKLMVTWQKVVDRSATISDSVITASSVTNLQVINKNNIDLVAQIENSFKASTANAAEAQLKETLGVNALSPNAKQLINQNITNNNVQITNILTNVLNESVTTADGSSNVEIMVNGPINIKSTTITATTALDLQQEDLNTMSQIMGQTISSDIINDISSTNGVDTSSAGLDDLVDALGEANAAAIRANAEGVGGDWVLYIIGGVIVIALVAGAIMLNKDNSPAGRAYQNYSRPGGGSRSGDSRSGGSQSGGGYRSNTVVPVTPTRSGSSGGGSSGGSRSGETTGGPPLLDFRKKKV